METNTATSKSAIRFETQRLLRQFAARRRMLLDHCPRHNAAEAIRTYARLRHDIAAGLRAARRSHA